MKYKYVINSFLPNFEMALAMLQNQMMVSQSGGALCCLLIDRESGSITLRSLMELCLQQYWTK